MRKRGRDGGSLGDRERVAKLKKDWREEKNNGHRGRKMSETNRENR